MSSFESSSLLFQGRRNSGSSKLAGGVFQSYAPLISSVLCPTRGWETKCFFLKGKSWDYTDELINVNHGMYSYLKTCISHFDFCWPYYSYCVCNWNILHIQRFNWEAYWWITVYQVHCDRFKCLFWFNSSFINLDTFSAGLAWNNWLCCKNSLLNNFKMHIKFWTFYFLS